MKWSTDKTLKKMEIKTYCVISFSTSNRVAYLVKLKVMVVGQGLYSQNILKSFLSPSSFTFLYLELFERNTASDWLNHMVIEKVNCVQRVNLKKTICCCL